MSDAATKKLMLFFPRWKSEQQIFYRLVKDHNLIVNVFRARVTPEEKGHMVLDVTGTDEDIQRGIDFIKTFEVTVNESGKGVIRDSDRCTHCGHCITHCPTGALYIADALTREVGYKERECIECLACIRVCPFAVIESAF